MMAIIGHQFCNYLRFLGAHIAGKSFTPCLPNIQGKYFPIFLPLTVVFVFVFGTLTKLYTSEVLHVTQRSAPHPEHTISYY